MSTHSARLDCRLDAGIKAIIERAASFQGQSLSAFAVSTLAEKARAVIQEHTMIELSQRDRKAFLSLTRGPAKPNAALRRAAARYKRRPT